MIQFNLLPDVKIDYIRTQRTKRMVMVGSLIAAAVSLILLAITFSYRATQSRHLSNLSGDIKSIRQELEGNKELTRILSVQNQLNKLPELYEGRPAAKRLSGYMEQTTPTTVRISKMQIDFTLNTMEISGNGQSLAAINEYVDTLKFTKFNTGEGTSADTYAFKNVVLSRFGTDKKGGTTFSIALTYDPQIFDQTINTSLVVPNTVTTYAQLGDSSKLFDTSGGNNE